MNKGKKGTRFVNKATVLKFDIMSIKPEIVEKLSLTLSSHDHDLFYQLS